MRKTADRTPLIPGSSPVLQTCNCYRSTETCALRLEEAEDRGPACDCDVPRPTRAGVTVELQDAEREDGERDGGDEEEGCLLPVVA